jgi:hypothetical protein
MSKEDVAAETAEAPAKAPYWDPPSGPAAGHERADQVVPVPRAHRRVHGHPHLPVRKRRHRHRVQEPVVRRGVHRRRLSRRRLILRRHHLRARLLHRRRLRHVVII